MCYLSLDDGSGPPYGIGCCSHRHHRRRHHQMSSSDWERQRRTHRVSGVVANELQYLNMMSLIPAQTLRQAHSELTSCVTLDAMNSFPKVTAQVRSRAD